MDEATKEAIRALTQYRRNATSIITRLGKFVASATTKNFRKGRQYPMDLLGAFETEVRLYARKED